MIRSLLSRLTGSLLAEDILEVVIHIGQKDAVFHFPKEAQDPILVVKTLMEAAQVYADKHGVQINFGRGQ